MVLKHYSEEQKFWRKEAALKKVTVTSLPLPLSCFHSMFPPLSTTNKNFKASSWPSHLLRQKMQCLLYHGVKASKQCKIKPM